MTTADATRTIALSEADELRRRVHARLEEEYPEALALRASHGRVVVGVRDSWHAADALAVGFAEAKRRGAALLVSVIRDVAGERGGLEPAFHAADQRDSAEADRLPRVVAAASRAFPGVAVTSVVQTGHFAEVLVELSHSADLVVLGMGDRRSGMSRKDLLIATNAQCPVIVVREPSHRDGA